MGERMTPTLTIPLATRLVVVRYKSSGKKDSLPRFINGSCALWASDSDEKLIEMVGRHEGVVEVKILPKKG